MTWLLVAAAVVVMPSTAARRQRGSRRVPAVGLNRVSAAGAAALCVALLPLPWSLLLAAAVAAAVWRFVPPSVAAAADSRLALARTLPDALHLLAALIRAGCTDQEALRLAADATPEPLGATLGTVARLRGLGADAAEAWREPRADPQLAALATVMARRSDTGAGVAAELERLAADARRDFFSRAQAAARAAAVRAVLPLAVCFLPSFFLLGVVPIVAALAGGLGY